MADWSPKFTRGVWPAVQRIVREGVAYRDAWDAIHRAGERPDAATFNRLWSRAVEGNRIRAAEADYRTRVSEGTYAARRPTGDYIARSPFGMATRYRQVVELIGTDPLQGGPKSVFVNVSTNRLLGRGEAIDQAMVLGAASPTVQVIEVEDAVYDSTWRAP